MSTEQGFDHRTQYSDKGLAEEIARAREMTEKFSRKVAWLPSIEKDGSSACPFVDDLYRDVEQELAQVALRLDHMRGYWRVVEAQVDKRRQDLGTIMTGWAAMDRGGAKDKVRDAESTQAWRYNSVIQLRDSLDGLLSKMESTIQGATHRLDFWRKHRTTEQGAGSGAPGGK